MFPRVPLLVLAGLAAGALAAFAMLSGLKGPPAAQTAIQTGKALIGGPFTLTDQDGKRVTEKDFLGKYMLVFFGFTHCPDICPSGLQVMAAALDQLGDKAKDVVPVFITLDPERDTPEKIGEYVKSFHSRFVGLTGSKDEVAAAAKAYRVYYQIVPDEKNQNEYTIDHAAIIYLMGKDGTFMTHVPHATNTEAIVTALSKAL